VCFAIIYFVPRVSHKSVEKELSQSAELVAYCKKLQSRIVHEIHTLQDVAQDVADGVKSLRYGWWRRKGTHDRTEEIETAVAFLQNESEVNIQSRVLCCVIYGHSLNLSCSAPR